MFSRRAIFATAVVGAAIGILILQVISLSVAWWYGSAASPLVLLLAPGIVVAGILKPMYPAAYFVAQSVGQAVVYAVLAVALRALLRRDRHAKKTAV
jgi:hypothetical protein